MYLSSLFLTLALSLTSTVVVVRGNPAPSANGNSLGHLLLAPRADCGPINGNCYDNGCDGDKSSDGLHCISGEYAGCPCGYGCNKNYVGPCEAFGCDGVNNVCTGTYRGCHRLSRGFFLKALLTQLSLGPGNKYLNTRTRVIFCKQMLVILECIAVTIQNYSSFVRRDRGRINFKEDPGKVYIWLVDDRTRSSEVFASPASAGMVGNPNSELVFPLLDTVEINLDEEEERLGSEDGLELQVAFVDAVLLPALLSIMFAHCWTLQGHQLFYNSILSHLPLLESLTVYYEYPQDSFDILSAEAPGRERSIRCEAILNSLMYAQQKHAPRNRQTINQDGFVRQDYKQGDRRGDMRNDMQDDELRLDRVEVLARMMVDSYDLQERRFCFVYEDGGIIELD
ncbi:hypothetical protein GGU10DRAFT_416466 [Lentinula aff. detonsa]|uniref:EGF-like domain-containing protein n=1 Tax=Lentinula aff. detonsa TaxID=2804958 RepID=A0AA38KHE0_9AGAR|nr:hypothetical protein GGU10DRAFT_416466 [Lentinula aff. detonsa]